MGLCVSLPSPYTTHATYTGAGILFSNPSVALAGVQKYWKVRKGSEAVLSGFGGRKEATDLDWFHTAWREVIEELLPESLGRTIDCVRLDVLPGLAFCERADQR